MAKEKFGSYYKNTINVKLPIKHHSMICRINRGFISDKSFAPILPKHPF